MEDKIKEAVEKAGSPSEVKVLSIHGIRCQILAGLTDEFVALEILEIINVGLSSLEGLPKLPKLKMLQLSDNKLGGEEMGVVASNCPSLEELVLVGNKVSKLDQLTPLTALKKLTHLDLFGCPVVEEVDGYRSAVFELLPTLKYLDGTDREDQEEEDSEEDEPGLEYLTKELDEEDDEEEDYDPEEVEEEEEEDYTLSDEEGTDEEGTEKQEGDGAEKDDGEGTSGPPSKKAKTETD